VLEYYYLSHYLYFELSKVQFEVVVTKLLLKVFVKGIENCEGWDPKKNRFSLLWRGKSQNHGTAQTQGKAVD
jgi:hypothetical protein